MQLSRMLKPETYLRSVLLACGAAYFVFAAAVQYNDPDPLHWMLLYLLSAILCGLAFFHRTPGPAIYLTAGMAVTEMAITVGGFIDWLRYGSENVLTAQMTSARPYIELTREFFGAAISLVVMLLLARFARKNTSRT